jgi:cysteinyl-tRNA synthetase
MSTKYLGETLDIHTASQDLVFPHHENEIAIAEALTGKPLANYWMHSGQLLKDGRKMTSDTGNIVTLREVVDRGYTGREIRFMLLGVHYRKPMLFSFKRLNAARTALKRIDEYTRKLLCLPAGLPHPEIASSVSELERRFTEAMNDDLNLSGAIGALFNFIKQTNPVVQARQLDREQRNDILEVLRMINTVLGVLRLEQCPLTPEIDRLIRQRERARQLKDWTAADSAREELLRKGVTIHDTAAGPIWERIDEDVH